MVRACFVAFFGAAVGVGCNPSADDGDEEQPLGVVAQAVYSGCATVSYDDTISSQYCSEEWSDSPSTSYGHGASCPDRWVVEFTGTVGSIDTFGRDGWADTWPANATDCTQARWHSNGYSYDGTSWTDLEFVTAQGSWDSGTSTCTFGVNAGQAEAIPSGITKLRVATWAYAHTRAGDIKRKARSSVLGTPCE